MLVLAWNYVSIATLLWWVIVQASNKHPDGSAVKTNFKRKRYWKARLLLMILKDWRYVLSLSNSTCAGPGWRANYQGWWPDVSVTDEA